eukprot:319993-Alexandrium_andersonii.AAC.1
MSPQYFGVPCTRQRVYIACVNWRLFHRYIPSTPPNQKLMPIFHRGYHENLDYFMSGILPKADIEHYLLPLEGAVASIA